MMIPTALIIIEQFFRQLIFANCLFSRLQVSGRRQGELSHSLVSCQLSTFWRRIFVTLLLTKMHSAICCCFLVPSVVSNNVALKKLFKCLTKEPHDGAKLKQIFFSIIILSHWKIFSNTKSTHINWGTRLFQPNFYF